MFFRKLTSIALIVMLVVCMQFTTFITLFSTIFGVYGDAANQIFTAFYNYLKVTDPSIDAVSYKADVKTHASYKSGYVAPIFSYVYYYKIKLYPEINYGGDYTSRNTFKVKLTV